MAEGLPSQSPPPGSSPKSAPDVRAEQLKAWLPLYLKKTDATISHINRLLSTPSGTDTVLCSLNYTLLALLQTVESLPHLLQRLPTISLSTKTKHISSGAAPSLRALASLISDIRIFLRLWGLLSIYAWGRSVFITDPPRDKVLRYIANAQVAVNTGFQVLENTAYLAQHGVWRGWSERAQGKMWVWSCRFWAMHTALDLLKLWRVREMGLELERKGKGREKKGEGEMIVATEDEKEKAAWWTSVVVNLAYAPMTVHYSLENGYLGESWVSALGSVAGIVGLRQAWKDTA
ncbi:MAG: hypothetical protein M4579_002327 [Chaenotheca gracillima]|nr:MAG: hypothetical protein M4579_002327 [Chaenotheca gracillima]